MSGAARQRVAVLISGRGSNLSALLDACAAPGFPAEIALVVSNAPGAEGLVKAAALGCPALTLDHRPFGRGDEGRRGFEAALGEALASARIDLVCLAGFMRMLTPAFVDRWRGRMLNIHPSLLPAYKGVNVHARMIADGVRIGGCTVHFVSPEMDAGSIIGQAAVVSPPGDTADSLAVRILALEHRLYPECLRLVASGAVRLSADGRTDYGALALIDGLTHPPAISFP